MTIDELAQLSQQIIEEIGRAVIGKEQLLKKMLMGILCEGHLLCSGRRGG